MERHENSSMKTLRREFAEPQAIYREYMSLFHFLLCVWEIMLIGPDKAQLRGFS